MFGIFKKQRSANKRWLVYALMSYIVMLVVNGLAGSTTLLGGVDTAAVSDAYPNLFAPSGYTFSIWGVIYLLLTAYLVRVTGLIGGDKTPLPIATQNTALKLFSLSSVLNIAWLFAWQYKVLWLSVLLMIGLLVTLIKIHRLVARRSYSPTEYALTQLPFSVYFGWICIATIANITTWLVSIGWNGWGLSEVSWMVAVLFVGAIIGLVTAYHWRDSAYLMVFVWAYGGILAKHMSSAGFDGNYPVVIVSLAILLAVFTNSVISLIYSARRN